MGALNLGIKDIFGNNSGPIMTVRVGDLLFDGLPICKDPGLIGIIACTQIRALADDVRNVENMADGSMRFSILKYVSKYLTWPYILLNRIVVVSLSVIHSISNGQIEI